MAFSNKLYSLRKQKGLSQDELVMNRLETIIDSINRENVKMYTKKISKIVLIIMVKIFAIDLISMIVYFILNGFPI
ncbi:hypothetical protein ACTQ4P_14190 [Clostridium sporogenes]|uniref:hypothetical protein n=1 Tax=Clostridium sporogenes TaxID=1509 RepID=UPI0029022631|nr:hypothetical protein [Clostridium botulinum]